MKNVTSLQEKRRRVELEAIDKQSIEAGCQLIESAILAVVVKSKRTPGLAVEINEHVTGIRRLLEGRQPTSKD